MLAETISEPVQRLSGHPADAAWTTDRWGRVLAGSGVVLCLTGYWATGASWLALLALGLGVEQVVTALVGWCPFHQMMRRLGIPDREEVVLQR